MSQSPLVMMKPQTIKSNKKIKLEIGSGKGRFITMLAESDPESLYVAMERDVNIAYRILQKQEEHLLDNLLIILNDAEHLEDFFEPNSIDTIYLNFSDPWPKSRHHKRRLTHETYNRIYRKLLKKNGVIELRTDHEDFFNDSIDYFRLAGFIVYDIMYESNEIFNMSEYEIKKRNLGPIYSFKVVEP